MDIEDLVIFRSVAAELSVTRAASRLGRVPSNVTTRIQQLEAELGIELFVRVGKRLTLSTAGETFLGYASRMLALSEEAISVVTGGKDGGSLRIGTMESTAASRLPAVLASFSAQFPKTRLEVSTGPSRQLIEHVCDGRLDGAFVALPESGGGIEEFNAAGLEARPLWNEELVILLPARDRDVRSVEQIETRSLAAFAQGCAYRALAEDVLGFSVTKEWRVQEMGSYHAMVASVAAGACVAILPRSVADMARVPDEVRLLPVAKRDTWFVWRRGFDAPAFVNFQKTLDQAQHGRNTK